MFSIFTKNKGLTLIAPMSGHSLALSDVPDKVFASGMMGSGLAFESEDNVVLAPCGGRVTLLPATKHAFGIKAKDGAEILVHIGLDTVNLNGKGFRALVNQGDKVEAGTPMIMLDREAITDAGFNLMTMLLITNSQDYQVSISEPHDVKGGETSVAVVNTGE